MQLFFGDRFWGKAERTESVSDDSSAQSLKSWLTDQQAIGYTGYLKDIESGLYYAKARHYDPRTARFITQDPEEGRPTQPPSLHRYLYAYANPTVYIDATGRASDALNAYDDERLIPSGTEYYPIQRGDTTRYYNADPSTWSDATDYAGMQARETRRSTSMAGFFLEAVLNAAELFAAGIQGRNEIDDPLTDAFSEAGLGEVSGGGSGSGVVILDVEIENDTRLDDALATIRRVLRNLGVPQSTFIRRYKPIEAVYHVYD